MIKLKWAIISHKLKNIDLSHSQEKLSIDISYTDDKLYRIQAEASKIPTLLWQLYDSEKELTIINIKDRNGVTHNIFSKPLEIKPNNNDNTVLIWNSLPKTKRRSLIKKLLEEISNDQTNSNRTRHNKIGKQNNRKPKA